MLQHFRRNFGAKTIDNSTAQHLPLDGNLSAEHHALHSNNTPESLTPQVTSVFHSEVPGVKRTSEPSESSFAKTTLGSVVDPFENVTSSQVGGSTVSQRIYNTSSFRKDTEDQSKLGDFHQGGLSALENPSVKKILYFNKVGQLKKRLG